jgi:hypothetical protein
MWFTPYKFERRTGRGWEHTKKVTVPDSVLASFIIEYLKSFTGMDWRVKSGDRIVCETKPRKRR